MATGKTVIVAVPAGQPIGETMNQIRIWLDHRQIRLEEFRHTEAPGGGQNFEFNFRTEDDAALFQREFGGVIASDP